MANQIRNNSAAGEARHETEIRNPHPILSSSRSRTTEKTDDVIVSLSDAYENRRARQVGEWERLYGQNVYRGA
jgi:hypothetical protein